MDLEVSNHSVVILWIQLVVLVELGLINGVLGSLVFVKLDKIDTFLYTVVKLYEIWLVII